jgi:hypothetical protein
MIPITNRMVAKATALPLLMLLVWLIKKAVEKIASSSKASRNKEVKT